VEQTYINILIGILCSVFGWMLNAIWQVVKDLQTQDMTLADKVSKIENLILGEYTKRDEFRAVIDAMFLKLDKISDNQLNLVAKLAEKQDRHDR